MANSLMTDGPRLRHDVDGHQSKTKLAHDDSDFEWQRQLIIGHLKARVKELHKDFVDEFDARILELMEDFVTKLDRCQLLVKLQNVSSKEKRKSQFLTQELPNKEFKSRPSLLSTLFENSHFQTIHNIFIAILIFLFLRSLGKEFVNTGSFHLDLDVFRVAFDNLHIALLIWLLMQLNAILVLYPGFHVWANNRHLHSEWFDYAWIIAYILYIGLFFYFPCATALEYGLPLGSASIVTAEQIRFIMKMHAFVRSNAPRALSYNPAKDKNGDSKEGACPNFSKYLYFLFVPTLVYRDHYPRKSHINWNYVFSNFLQMFASIFLTYFVWAGYYIKVFHKFGQETMTVSALLPLILESMLFSMILCFCLFYGLLHSWFNAFAEMLKFSDRMFYKDWWTSTTYANFYRTWNVVVHDWLYTYIYKEFHDLLKDSKTRLYVPKMAVFLISALIHEYILSVGLHFCYPVIFILFGFIGTIFAFVAAKLPDKFGNILIWMGLFVGFGLLASLYSLEYYARINCPPYLVDSFYDAFVPRTWVCKNTIAW